MLKQADGFLAYEKVKSEMLDHQIKVRRKKK
jgi:hypothetical protein